MELNIRHSVNFVSHLKRGSFVIAPLFNEVMSEQYLNYREQLLYLKSCSDNNEWFESLDYPPIEIGQVVLVKVNNKPNAWARGIISKYDNNKLSPEIYLIDYQIFLDRSKKYELKICPPTFLRLKLPTYTVHTDLCLDMDDDTLNYAIEIMINKNQHSKINVIFLPQSIQNNEYTGLFLVESVPLNKYLQIMLIQNSTKKDLALSVFNPMRFHHLKNIFIPKHSSNLAFLDENLVSSHSSLNDLFSSHENLSCDPFDEYSTTIDHSKDCSDESSLSTIESSKNGRTNSTYKQKVYSSRSPSSSSSVSDSSTRSYAKEHGSPKRLSGNKLTVCTCENSENHQRAVCLETTVDDKDKNKSNVENTSMGVENQDISEKKPFIYTLMRKRCSILRQQDAERRQNNNIVKISKVSKPPENLSLLDDSVIWWSSDEES